MKEADDQDLQAKLERQRRKRNKTERRFNCNCQALRTSQIIYLFRTSSAKIGFTNLLILIKDLLG